MNYYTTPTGRIYKSANPLKNLKLSSLQELQLKEAQKIEIEGMNRPAMIEGNLVEEICPSDCITRYQLISKLRADGELTAARSVVSGQLKDAFEHKEKFSCSDPHLNQLLDLMGKSESQKNSFFSTAITIQ